MKNLFTFLCVVALLTGSLVGCNREEAKPSPTPVNTANVTANPENVPDPADGVIEDDDGILTPEESAKP